MKIIIKILKKLANKGYFNWMPDEMYIQLMYRLMTEKKLNIKNPLTFNEKLQWIKLYDRNPRYTKLVDKYEVRKFIKNVIGEEYLIPLLGVYDNFDEIDFNKLPNEFVIKCTHDSGGLIICKDKNTLDFDMAKTKIESSLKRNYYYYGREWPYKHVQPRIIIEKFMQDKNQPNMRDYKFFCFNGKPELMYLSEGLEDHSTAKMSFYDMNFNPLNLKRKDYSTFKENIKKPTNFEKMKEFASILSKDIPHIRVDFYEINNKLYFGELTFFTCSGHVPFEPEEWDYKLGQKIKLPQKNINFVKGEKNEKY